MQDFTAVILISKGHVLQFHKRRLFLCDHRSLQIPYSLRQFLQRIEFIDPVHARNGGLYGLDLHSQTLHWGKDLGDIVNYRYRCTGRHTEQCQHLCITGGRKQHHNRHHDSIQDQDHRGINSIIEIRAIYRAITLRNIFIIPFLHIVLFSQRMNGADIVQRLRHMSGGSAHSTTVLDLGFQHVFLHRPGEPIQKWQQDQKYDRQSSVF